MKILILHNSYQQSGGEDTVVRREAALLSAASHQVSIYSRHNRDINQNSFVAKISAASNAVWAWESHRELAALLKKDKPDLAHFHNTFPLISPSACYACHDAGVPVVQTLHNYRLFCAPAIFFRNGEICEECSSHNLLRGIRHACYHDSRIQTAGVALTLAVHRRLQTWVRMVDCYIAPTEFVRKKFIAAGLPAERVLVKPNFVDPDPGDQCSPGEYAIYVGRLTQEKGLRTLLEAWRRLEGRIPLVIVGDGPMRKELQQIADQQNIPSVSFTGSLPNVDTIRMMKRARFLVFPSEWYETFGTTIVEAFACGLPVVCSKLGAMRDLVSDGRTGLHFAAADPLDLAIKISWAWNHPDEMRTMGGAARLDYETKYTPEQNYRLLMKIYSFALRSAEEHVERLPLKSAQSA